MIDDPSRNPGLLKLDLYCKGMRLDESCFTDADGGRPIVRTRAGLGSGLELILPDSLWTNVPVTEPFTRRSPYMLRKDKGRYRIDRDGQFVADVELSPLPTWYERKTAQGRTMRRVGTLQGTYLGVYPARVCEYCSPHRRISPRTIANSARWDSTSARTTETRRPSRKSWRWRSRPGAKAA